MNRTIYVQEEHAPVWEKAMAFAKGTGTSIASVLIPLLIEFLDKQPQCACGEFMLPRWKHCPTCGKKAVK